MTVPRRGGRRADRERADAGVPADRSRCGRIPLEENSMAKSGVLEEQLCPRTASKVFARPTKNDSGDSGGRSGAFTARQAVLMAGSAPARLGPSLVDSVRPALRVIYQNIFKKWSQFDDVQLSAHSSVNELPSFPKTHPRKKGREQADLYSEA